MSEREEGLASGPSVQSHPHRTSPGGRGCDQSATIATKGRRREIERLSGFNAMAARWGKAFLFPAFGATFLVTMLIVGGLGFVRPDWRDFLSREDGPIESLTAAIYLLGLTISLVAIVRAGMERRNRAEGAMIGLLCLFGALEELSYGRRLISGEGLGTVLGIQVDALHDVVDVARVAVARSGNFGLMLGVAAALALIGIGRPVLVWSRSLWVQTSGFRFVVIAFGLGITALLLDNFQLSVYLEETLELQAAWAMFFAALASWPGRVRPPNGSRGGIEPSGG